MKRPSFTLSLILALLLVLALLVGGIAWLFMSEAGLQAAAGWAQSLSGNRLQLEQVSGRFRDRLQIGRLHWHDEGTEVELKGISLHWSPAALLHGRLDIHALGLGDITVQTQSDDSPTQLPQNLALPLDIRVSALETQALTINGSRLADHLGAVFDSHAGLHTLSALEARRGEQQLNASATLGASAPFVLKLDASLSGVMSGKPYALALAGTGDLSHNQWRLKQTQGPFNLAAEAALQPFAAQPIERFFAQADKLDLAGLIPGLPHTQIDIRCSLETAQQGGCRIENRLAGPLDQDRLPLKEITAQLQRREQALLINGIRILLGQGVLTGGASMGEAGTALKLEAQKLSLADIHGKLQQTQLAGPIVLNANAQGEVLKLDLKDKSLATRSEIARAGNHVALKAFELQAQQALLKASGKLNTVTMDFALSGSFSHFDPSRFVRTASGDINGDFKTAGRLGKAPRLSFEFGLNNSRFANAPANGKGSVELAWPQLRRSDVSLVLGQNTFRLLGALGKPNEVLKLDINAPALKPYGLEGDMQVHMEARGTLTALLLNGKASSNSLRIPGYGRLQQFSLDTNVGTELDSPFELRLQAGRFDLADRRNLVRQFDLSLQGTRRQHRLQLSSFIDEQKQLQVALSGAFKSKDIDAWQGVLSKLTLDNPEAHRNLKLEGEAPLAFATDRWAVGPLKLQTHRAEFVINAAGIPGKTTAKLVASNPEIGRVVFDLVAQTEDAWGFSAQTPWQGQLQADIRDIGWLNPLLDPGWQVGGKLRADLKLSGTPQYPLINGRLDAENLLVRNHGLGMHLRNGVLHADIRESLLKLHQFEMESVLTSPPAAVRRLVEDAGRLAALTATPGRIKATGTMKLGTLGTGADTSEQLSLDITLDRLGVSQIPKQWLLLSGDSRLNWQQGKLGIKARLAVDAAHWQLADLSRPQLSSDVVILGQDEAESASTTPWSGEIAVDMGRYFSFEGAGARGRLAGRVEITASATDLPRARGSVNLVNGRYEAYGQQLAIERGILNFQGLLENPALNILAMRRGQQVDAGVEITGYAQAPKIRLVSEPYVPDTEKLSWLVLGRAPDQSGSDAGILLGAVGAIFGNQSNNVGNNVKQSFGIDEFSVHSGTLGQSQNMNSRIAPLSSSNQSGQVLSVGRQLTKQLRLSYEQALGTTGNLVKLTFKLTDRISVVGTSGSDAAVDVFYGFAFGGNSAKERPRRSGTD